MLVPPKYIKEGKQLLKAWKDKGYVYPCHEFEQVKAWAQAVPNKDTCYAYMKDELWEAAKHAAKINAYAEFHDSFVYVNGVIYAL